MKSLVAQKGVPLASLISEPTYFLNQIAVRYAYKDGKRTDEIAGYVYTVTNTESYEQICVTIEGNKPLMSIEKFTLLREQGEKIFIQFQGGIVRPYYSETMKAIQDSVKASDIQQVVDLD